MFRLRKTIVIWGIFAAPLVTLMLAGISEHSLPDGFVKYIAYLLAVGSSIITLIGLGSILVVFIIQIWRHEGRHETMIYGTRGPRVFANMSENSSTLIELGKGRETKFVVIPSGLPLTQPLETANFPENLMRQLTNGGIS
jgi:hypothetical protein